jgi:DNA-binding NtrC family response regulator
MRGDMRETRAHTNCRAARSAPTSRKQGLVEVADKGSISFDEIREMNLALQAKLLTVLDTQSFRRVGAVKPIRVDLRLHRLELFPLHMIEVGE